MEIPKHDRLSQLKGFSDLLDKPFPIGLPSENLDELLGLGETMATSRPGLIVWLEGPALQRWQHDVPAT